MSNFSYKDVYIEEGKRVLEVNILPEKYCNFDCIFCPIGRSKNKVDSQISFNEIDVDLNDLYMKIFEGLENSFTNKKQAKIRIMKGSYLNIKINNGEDINYKLKDIKNLIDMGVDMITSDLGFK